MVISWTMLFPVMMDNCFLEIAGGSLLNEGRLLQLHITVNWCKESNEFLQDVSLQVRLKIVFKAS